MFFSLLGLLCGFLRGLNSQDNHIEYSELYFWGLVFGFAEILIVLSLGDRLLFSLSLP